MSYTITISGHVSADNATDAQTVEQQIVDALSQAIAGLPAAAGVTAASGSFQYLGSVSLLPAPPAPPAPTLEQAVAELTAAVDLAVDPAADGSVTLTADEWAALGKAAQDVETAAAAPAETAEAPMHAVAL